MAHNNTLASVCFLNQSYSLFTVYGNSLSLSKQTNKQDNGRRSEADASHRPRQVFTKSLSPSLPYSVRSRTADRGVFFQSNQDLAFCFAQKDDAIETEISCHALKCSFDKLVHEGAAYTLFW